MIEIVRAKAKTAKQPWHARVVAEGNAEPLLAGETLVDQQTAEASLAALGRLFSPVDRAECSNGQIVVWLDADEHGEKLHVPVQIVDLREDAQTERVGSTAPEVEVTEGGTDA